MYLEAVRDRKAPGARTTKGYVKYRLSRFWVFVFCVACGWLAFGCTTEFGSSGATCGNGTLEAGETCDGSDFGGQTCFDLTSYEEGRLICTQDCKLDLSLCHTCGNGVVEGGEVCDGSFLGGETCESQGYYEGELACASDCLSFDLTGCALTCGDGVINGPEGGEILEECDGDDLGGATCENLGLPAGTLVCGADCTLDTSGCVGSGGCGDGVKGDEEQCDGADLGGVTCADLSYGDGELACSSDCTFDVSRCEVSENCGDGSLDPGEECDDGGESASCNGDCTVSLCGDSKVNGTAGEECDDGGESATCDVDCTAVWCNDGVLNVTAGEECDENDLGGATCADFGCWNGGGVSCSTNCTLDPTSCHAGHDEDGDGVDDNCDNCPSFPNSNQDNSDGDEVGDSCDPDPLITQISFFEPMVDQESDWTVDDGDWTYGGDQVSGQQIGTIANYLYTYAPPNQPYVVGTTFYYGSSNPSGDSTSSGVVFARTAPLHVYTCQFNRDENYLGIWRLNGDPTWELIQDTNVSTSAGETQWRQVTVFYDGTTFNCRYDDETGVTVTVQPDLADVQSDMSGDIGLSIYNDDSVFTSFFVFE